MYRANAPEMEKSDKAYRLGFIWNFPSISSLFNRKKSDCLPRFPFVSIHVGTDGTIGVGSCPGTATKSRFPGRTIARQIGGPYSAIISCRRTRGDANRAHVRIIPRCTAIHRITAKGRTNSSLNRRDLSSIQTSWFFILHFCHWFVPRRFDSFADFILKCFLNRLYNIFVLGKCQA